MARFLVNMEKRLSVKVDGNCTLSSLSSHTFLSGSIGKTSLGLLLNGEKACINGWKIIEQKTIQKANKTGIPNTGNGKVRKRLPMKINCTLTLAGKKHLAEAKGDMREFLACIGQDCVEYQDIADRLGWSRDMVSIYAAKTVTSGWIEKARYSQKVHAYNCQQL